MQYINTLLNNTLEIDVICLPLCGKNLLCMIAQFSVINYYSYTTFSNELTLYLKKKSFKTTQLNTDVWVRKLTSGKESLHYDGFPSTALKHLAH